MEPGPSRDEVRVLAVTTGTNALIYFNPTYGMQHVRGADAWAPHASLLHELVHAVNITWGTFEDRPYTTDEAHRRGAPDPEEEIAWVIDNMYRSEIGMWLRQRYDGEALVRPDGSLSASSNTFAMEAVARCNRRVRPLAALLERIPCRYNPFREYARLPPTARP